MPAFLSGISGDALKERKMLIPQGTKKILLIQLGDIGDVVYTVPTIHAVKKAFPQAEISLLLREGNGALLAFDPAVSGIWEVRKGKGSIFSRLRESLRFLWNFYRAGFEVVIDLRASERGAYMAFLTGAPIRISQAFKDVSFLRNRLFTHLVNPLPRRPDDGGAVEQSLRIIRATGIEAKGEQPTLFLDPVAKERMIHLLKELGIYHRPWLSLSPFSRWDYKELPTSTWQKVMTLLSNKGKVPMVLVGGVQEAKKAEVLVKGLKNTVEVYNLAGKTNLADLASLLSLSTVHLGVDSGAVHIAAAVGTPTVSVFGPSNYQEWAPRGEKHKVVLGKGDCVPCGKKGCNHSGYSRCLVELSPYTIVGVVEEILKGLI